MTTTLARFASGQLAIHPAAAWYLSDLGEFRGQQVLYTRQAPQRLKAWREHAIIESALASNRIEGVTIDPARVRAVLVAAKPLFRDRDEEEVRGYREALAWIHREAATLPIDDPTITRLHALTHGQIWDAGLYKEQDGDIIERLPDGRSRVRFRTVPAAAVAERMAELLLDWRLCREQRWVHPLLGLAAFNLDFLCIHPFRDGNGRVSRLLWLLRSLPLGYEVGRYLSLERLVEENKERYYETLDPVSSPSPISKPPVRGSAAK